MKKSIICAALFALFPFVLSAPSHATEKSTAHDERIAVSIKEKCGFIDGHGKLVIPAKYDYAASFLVDGLAAVSYEKTGKRALIDKTGKVVMTFPEGVWDSDGSRNDQLIVIDNGKKSGFMDRSGQIVLAPQWDEADGFDGHKLAPVKLNGKWGYINRNGLTVVPFIYSRAESFSNGRADVSLESSYGQLFTYVLSEDGTLRLKPTSEAEPRNDFARDAVAIGEFYYPSEPNASGLKTALLKTADNIETWVLLNKDSKQVGKQFMHIYLDNDQALFSANLRNKTVNEFPFLKYGYINEKGKIALPFIYDDALGFNGETSAFAAVKGKWGKIDRNGKWLVRPKFQSVGYCKPTGLRMPR